jgi:hypothetical protein
MKKIVLFFAFLSIVSPVFSQKKSASKSEKIKVSLAEALEKKYVSCTMVAPHGYNKLQLRITNTLQKPLTITVAQGQLFNPDNPDLQTLVNANEQILVISPQKTRDLELKTFCTESSKGTPTDKIGFSVGLLASERILKVLQFLTEKNKMETGDAQNAVWAASENSRFSPAGIGDREIVTEVCRQINRSVPNYRVRYETQNVPGRPSFEGNALVVDGNYEYFLEKDKKLFFNLFDSEGKLIKVLSKGQKMSAGSHKSSLHLEVKGLKQGRYFVRLQTENGENVKEIPVEF